MKIKKNISIPLWILMGALVLPAGTSQSQTPQNSSAEIKSLIQKGDNQLKEITEANSREAIKSYEAALKIDPDNYEANWKMSKAYCQILDLKTAGVIEEKEENKPILKELGTKAEYYADKAYAQNPKGPEALNWYVASYAYHASSMGILQAILKGAGGKLKKLANELIAVDPAASDALAYRMLGRLYLSAPFPVGDKNKALEYFEKGVEVAPGSLMNRYWLGEVYRAKGKSEDARKEFQFVLDEPSSGNEQHISGLIKEAAHRRLVSL